MIPHHILKAVLAAVFLLGPSSCGEAMPGAREGIPVEPPTLRPSDGLLETPVLMEVVDLGIQRNGEALRGFLDHDDPAVRARAAFALASVQDPDAQGELTELLGDPEPSVRRDAAFALGQLELTDGGAALMDALGREDTPEVRVRLIDAVGRAGSEEAL